MISDIINMSISKYSSEIIMLKKISAVIFILAILTVSVSANDGVMGRNGESVYLMDDSDVSMVSEDIVLTYPGRSIPSVECTFIFTNTGEAKTVLMGFPAMVKYDPHDLLNDPENLRLTDFTAFRNGIPVEVKELDGADIDNGYPYYTSWYVFEVTFDAGETLTMTHSYNLHLGGDSGGNIFMGYVLETGSSWKGDIEHSRVTFDISVFNAYAVQDILDTGFSPFRYPLSSLTYEEGKIIFDRRNFVPRHNIALWLSYWGIKDFHQIDDFRTEDEWESVAFFEAAPDYTESQLIEAYNNLSYQDKIIETIYLNTVLGLSETNTAPYVSEIRRNESDGFTVNVTDPDFDMDIESVLFQVISEHGKIVQEKSSYGSIYFGDYGTRIFNTKETRSGNSFEVTVKDHSGNTTVSIFNSYLDLVEVRQVNKPGDEIENPQTSATVQNGFLLSLVFLATGIFLVILRKKPVS